MRDLHLHLASGTELAFAVDDGVAHAAVAMIRDYWQDPGSVPTPQVLQFGEHDEIDSWVPFAHVIAVQSYPAAEHEPGMNTDLPASMQRNVDFDDQEVAADGPS